jgi:hypothetical protein
MSKVKKLKKERDIDEKLKKGQEIIDRINKLKKEISGWNIQEIIDLNNAFYKATWYGRHIYNFDSIFIEEQIGDVKLRLCELIYESTVNGNFNFHDDYVYFSGDCDVLITFPKNALEALEDLDDFKHIDFNTMIVYIASSKKTLGFNKLDYIFTN